MSDYLQQRAILDNINVKQTGATIIFRTALVLTFYPTEVIVWLSSASGLMMPPAISIGHNQPTFDNIISQIALTGLTATSKVLTLPLRDLTTSVPPNTDVRVRVSTAATGTSGSLKVSLIGFYE